MNLPWKNSCSAPGTCAEDANPSAWTTATSRRCRSNSSPPSRSLSTPALAHLAGVAARAKAAEYAIAAAARGGSCGAPAHSASEPDETRCGISLDLLGGLLRAPVQYFPARLRHDSRRSGLGSWDTPHLPLLPARLGNLPRLSTGRHRAVLSFALGNRPAISQRASDRLEKGLAHAARLAVLNALPGRDPSLDPRSFACCRGLVRGDCAAQFHRSRCVCRRA